MPDNPKLISLLGMCRRANRLSCGHDAAIGAIRKGTACICFLSSDASQRLRSETERELSMAKAVIPLYTLSSSMDEIGYATGLRSAVLTVNDSGFAQSMSKLMNKEENE